jgi:hypothetical protein
MLHHEMLVNQATKNVAADQAADRTANESANLAANTQHTEAATQALVNPRDKYTPIQTDSGFSAFDPSTGKAAPVMGADGTQVGSPGKQPHIVTTEDGNVVSIAPDENGVPKATVVYQGTPKAQTEVTKLEVDGKPHTVIVDKRTGETVKDLGETGEKPPSVSVSAGGTWSLAEDGQGKPILFNNKTGAIQAAPEGMQKIGTAAKSENGTGTVADKNRTSLAHIAMQNLDHIQDVIQRRPDLVGPGLGRISSVDQLLGSNDPDLVALGNEVHNFAMANAGIHGSRSFENVRAGEEMLLNHLKSGQQGILGGIKANKDNLTEIISRTEGGKAGGQANIGTSDSGKGVALSAAMALPQNKGKSEADVVKDIEAHGHTVIR